MKPDLSLILACFNESSHIKNSIKIIVNVLEKSNLSYEIILIDDASTDSTKKLIREFSKKHKKIKYFFHKKNIGRGGTVQEGIMKAKGDVVGFIDIDLEVKPDYIPNFVRLIKSKKADVVTGKRHYPFMIFSLQYLIRTVLSVGYSGIVKMIFNLPIKDTETGYKFFNRSKILPVLEKVKDKHWFWDTEIVARSHLHGLKILELPVVFLRNKKKKSTVKLVPDIAKYFRALFLFRSSLMQESGNFGKLYNFPSLYTFAMKVLYGKKYGERYKPIAQIINSKSSVVDVCCGDCELYNYLKNKNISYLGLDISYKFVRKAINKGLKAKLFDLRYDKIPASDYVILQGSLYQFNDPKEIIKKLYKAAKKKLIISEPVQNLANHFLISNIFFRNITRFFVNTENKNPLFRYKKGDFKSLLSIYNPKYVKTDMEKDLIAVIKK